MLQIPHYVMLAIRSEQANREARRRAKVKASFRKLSHPLSVRLVDSAARILRTGEPTRFEFEGACRHGIRRSLILSGWKWADADNAASEVVAKALRQIGATRPTWDQGQPECAANFKVERHWCAREGCHHVIPDERRNGREMYCSIVCGQAAYQAKAWRSGERLSKAEWLAACARKSAETVEALTRNCEYEPCSKPFIADRYYSKFCSYPCAHKAATKLPEAECGNPECKKLFQPRMVRARGKVDMQPQKYCCTACMAIGRWGKRENTRTCMNPQCRANFEVKFPSVKKAFCSPYCVREGQKQKGRSAFRCEPAGPAQEWDITLEGGR